MTFTAIWMLKVPKRNKTTPNNNYFVCKPILAASWEWVSDKQTKKKQQTLQIVLRLSKNEFQLLATWAKTATKIDTVRWLQQQNELWNIFRWFSMSMCLSATTIAMESLCRSKKTVQETIGRWKCIVWPQVSHWSPYIINLWFAFSQIVEMFAVLLLNDLSFDRKSNAILR